MVTTAEVFEEMLTVAPEELVVYEGPISRAYLHVKPHTIYRAKKSNRPGYKGYSYLFRCYVKGEHFIESVPTQLLAESPWRKLVAKYKPGDEVVVVNADPANALLSGDKYAVFASRWERSFVSGKIEEFLDVKTPGRRGRIAYGWMASRFEFVKGTIEPTPTTKNCWATYKTYGPFRNSQDARAYLKIARLPFFVRNDITVHLSETEDDRKVALAIRLTNGNIFIEEANADDVEAHAAGYLDSYGGGGDPGFGSGGREV